jgi:hypothetical protein
LGRLAISNFTARKFPQSPQQPFGLALGDQNPIVFKNNGLQIKAPSSITAWLKIPGC